MERIIEAKLHELETELLKADQMIQDILDSEPEANCGEYGKRVAKLFETLNWLDFCCIQDR